MLSTATITQQRGPSISLQPHLAILNARRRSSVFSTTSSSSISTLPSPSIVAARAYYLEQATRLGGDTHGRESLNEGQLSARKGSTLDTSSKLSTQLENFSFENRKDALKVSDEDHEDALKTESMEVDSRSEEEEVSLARRKSTITPRAAEILSKVPFEYTHNHLRGWGYAYLGNVNNADVFVDAVPLRRDSTQEEHGNDSPQKLTTIRARVFPASKDGKPFLIQKDFDVDALRATIPSPTKYSRFLQFQRSRSSSRRRSSSRSSRPSKQGRRGSETEHLRCALPIHISYALHFLPVLGALMLSGHIQKGDTISLPLPHPSAWRATVTYIYTGDVSILTPETKENVRFCGGWAY